MRTRLLTALFLAFLSVAFAEDTPAIASITSPQTNTPRNYVDAPPSATTNTIADIDVVPGSVRMLKRGTNSFAVLWTYTEAGATKALASWESDSRHHKMSAQWKEGWLKRRTNKGFFKTEAAAIAFMSKLQKE